MKESAAHPQRSLGCDRPASYSAHLCGWLVALVGFSFAGLSWADEKKGDAAETTKPAANWIDYGQALSRAETEDKHVLIDFYTKWCGWCKVMDRQTYSDPRVVDLLNTSFLIAKVDAESPNKMPVDEGQVTGRDLARQFGVQSYPMTWFLKPDGSRLGNIPGYQKPDRFLELLEYVNARRYNEKNDKNE